MKLQQIKTSIGELQVPTRETDGELVVAHEFLKSMLTHESMAKRGLKVAYEFVKTEPSHSICICTFTTNDGLSLQTVGESTDDSLKTDIGRKYPSLMAAKRALGEGILIILGIPKAYSDVQMGIDPILGAVSTDAGYSSTKKTKKTEKKTTKAEQLSAAELFPDEKISETEPEPVRPSPPKSAPAKTEQPNTSNKKDIEEDEAVELDTETGSDATEEDGCDEAVDIDEIARKTEVVPEDISEEDVSDEPPVELDELFKTTVNVGFRKKLGITVAELGKKYPKDLIWIAETLTMTEENKIAFGKVRDACVKWLELYPETRTRAKGGDK